MKCNEFKGTFFGADILYKYRGSVILYNMKRKPIKKIKLKRAAHPKKVSFKKTVCFQITADANATHDECERHEALQVTFGNFLFQNKIGCWGGSEAGLSKSGFSSTMYWYIMEGETKRVTAELKRMVKNFSVNAVIKIEIGEPLESETDFEKQILKQKFFSWIYYRRP
jgi:hypothetical protein